MKLKLFGKVGIINGDKFITTAYYLNWKGKLYVKNIDKNSYNLHPENITYDIKIIQDFAKKEKYKLDYKLHPNGESLDICFEKTDAIQPFIDITLTNKTDYQNSIIEKRWRLEKINIEKHYISKNFLRRENFYELLVNKEDYANSEYNPIVYLFSNIKENMYVKILGNRIIAERFMKKVNQL